MKNIAKLLMLLFIVNAPLFAHNIEYEEGILKEWIVEGELCKGSFMLYRNDTVFIETNSHKIVRYPLSCFTKEDQLFLSKKINGINVLNKQLNAPLERKNHKVKHVIFQILIALMLLFSIGVFVLLLKARQKHKYAFSALFAGFSVLLASFTDPNIIRNAFLPFAPNVNTFWDDNYFYVESKGIPDTHTMMVGISNHGWQQQVPIPQCYIGSNAWSIPLNPIMASTPIPVNQVHFTRGAIAIAVNGVPIFNPYTNTGVDAFLDGQLDNYGGHSGRGDDYHYHTAPLHLYNQTTDALPIAYAFDGFAVYGSLEPDGVAMTTLDANHGHFYNGEYHYHGTGMAPYMIAQFAGVVTEDATHQLIPQAHAQPVRTEDWTPLNGALITACTPNTSNNGYNLTYSLSGITGYATNYSWNGTVYTFNYVTPTGSTTINYNGFTQCDVPVYVSEATQMHDIDFYPNPFSDKIYPQNASVHEYYILYSSLGQIVYSGKNIEQQNFSQIANGAYYLKVKSKNKLFQLIKQ